MAAVAFMFVLLVILAIIGSSQTPSTVTNPNADAAKPAETASSNSTPLLELKNSRCYKEYDYVITEGSVTNISTEPLRSVAAVAGYYDASGDFITSGDALISYNPILPGQTSPFKTMTTDNPAIKRCDVTFKYLLGGTIEMRDASPHKKQKRS